MAAPSSLVPVRAPQGGALAIPQAHLAIEGMESLTQADLRLPRWTIVQPVSRMDDATKHIGEFYRNIDGEFRPYLDCVCLKVDPTRAMYDGGTDSKGPECFSRDGIHGSQYGLCAECQFNPRANPELMADIKEARARGKRSEMKSCSAGYTYIIVDDPDQMTMALFSVYGTSTPTAVTLNTLFAQKRKALFTWIVRFTTVQERGDRGNYYVLKAEVVKGSDGKLRENPPERIAEFREMYQSLQGITIKEATDDEGEAPVPADPVPAAPATKDSLF